MLYRIITRENPLNRAEKKFYAAPSYTDDVTLRKVAQDISSKCTLTPADVSAVLESFLDILPRYLEDGHSIKMGDFGRFRLSFKSEGHTEKKDVTADDIKSPRILFVPSNELKTKLENIRYAKR